METSHDITDLLSSSGNVNISVQDESSCFFSLIEALKFLRTKSVTKKQMNKCMDEL